MNAILTWAGFINDPEGSYPISVCSTTKNAMSLDLNAGGQHTKLLVEAMLKIYHIDHLKGVRSRLDIAHFKGKARV